MTDSWKKDGHVVNEKTCKLSDDAWDGIAAVTLIAITVSGLAYWLSNI